MLQITQNTTYAVRCLVYLKDHPGKFLPLKQIAAGTHIPAPFLSKILQNMTRHGFTGSARGSGGGFRLALPVEKISMYDIAVAASGGNSALKVPCLRCETPCALRQDCRLRSVWSDLGEVVDMHLRSRTLAQL